MTLPALCQLVAYRREQIITVRACQKTRRSRVHVPRSNDDPVVSLSGCASLGSWFGLSCKVAGLCRNGSDLAVKHLQKSISAAERAESEKDEFQC